MKSEHNEIRRELKAAGVLGAVFAFTLLLLVLYFTDPRPRSYNESSSVLFDPIFILMLICFFSFVGAIHSLWNAFQHKRWAKSPFSNLSQDQPRSTITQTPSALELEISKCEQPDKEQGYQLMKAVNSLLTDFHSFALLAEKQSKLLGQYTFEVIDHQSYPVGVWYFCIHKPQVTNAEEAFSLLFLRELYYENDWGIDDEWGDWAHYLENRWIPDKFSQYQDRTRPDLNAMSTRKFIEEITYWMEHCKVDKNVVIEFAKSHSKASVIKIGDVYAGYRCFGETEDRYFIAEFGCGYD